MSYLLIAAAAAMFRFAGNPLHTRDQKDVDAVVTRLVITICFIPQVVALFYGSRLVWQHFFPEHAQSRDAKMASELGRVALAFNQCADPQAVLSREFAILSEPDKEALARATRILFCEDQMRVFSLRKSLGSGSIREQSRHVSVNSLQAESERASFRKS